MIIIGGIGNLGNLAKSNNSLRNKTTQANIIITASNLFTVYEKNEIKAEQVYKGKKVEITGIIDSIGTDILDNPYVKLSSGEKYSMTGVQCFFEDKDEIEKVANLNTGETVTIIGIVDGKLLNIFIKNCFLK